MISIENVSKSYGNFEVLKALSVDFGGPGISCILGPSGCGKTTLLRIMAGLEKPDSGSVAGRGSQPISIVFQDPVLLPWKTVFQNIALPIRRIRPEGQWKDTAMKYLKLVQLESFVDYYPGQLSKGMKQRTAIARALCFPAEMVLMDEPFNSLDIKLRQHVMMSVRDEIRMNKKNLIFISHDPDEALFMSNRIYVFKKRPASGYRIFEVAETTSQDDFSRIRAGIIASMERQEAED